MRVVLVDDEPIALRRLALALQDVAGVEVVGSAGDGLTAEKLIAEKTPDVVILDIQMPGRTGLSLAASLPVDDRPEVIFVTAFEHFAPDAFDVEAADYVLKPVRIDRLRQAIERTRRRIGMRAAQSSLASLTAEVQELSRRRELGPNDGRPNAIWAPAKGGEVRVAAAAIIWIEAAGDYVIVHTAHRSHMIRATLTELEEMFSPELIRRVHRSAMVNMTLVEGVKRPGRGAITLVLEAKTEVPVGPNYADAVAVALKLT
ncbi:MAG: DNA-binding response regulator [Phenylobacterium zucineum]|nr:MAG: DNA-binding response regulator [Phenylobacterium zucineum]